MLNAMPDNITHASSRFRGTVTGIRAAVTCVAALTAVLHAVCSHANEPQPVSIDRAVQALEISELAATHNMRELSLRAFRQALSAGPPTLVAPHDIQQAISLRLSQRMSTIQIINANNSFTVAMPPGGLANQPAIVAASPKLSEAPASGIQLVERHQRSLDRLWRQQEFPPETVYETLTAVVLPERHPQTFHSYRSQDHNAQGTEQSIAIRLIDWAVQADRTDDLLTRLARRTSSLDAALYRAEICLYTRDTIGAGQALEAIGGFADRGFDQANNDRALSVVLRAVGQGVSVHKALPIIDRATTTMTSATRTRRTVTMTTGQLEPLSTLLLASARLHFEAGHHDAGTKAINSYLSINNTKANRYSKRHARELRRHQLLTAAGVLFDADQTDQAVDHLERAAGLPSRYVSDATRGTLQHLTQYLTTMDRDDRYQQLRRICLPHTADGSVSLMNALLPAAVPPTDILAIKGGTTPPHGSDLKRLIGTGTLLLDAAAAAGQLSRLQGELEKLVINDLSRDTPRDKLRDKPNASALLSVLYCRVGNTAAALPLVQRQTDSIGYDIRTRQKSRDPLVDVMVCAAAARNIRTAPAAKVLAEEIRRYCKSATTPNVVGALNDVTFATVEASGIPRSGRPAIWQQATTVSIRQLDQGAAAPQWSADDGVLTCLSGSGRNSLYFPFPLTGSFQFTVETSADPHTEAGVGYGGIYLETFNDSDNSRIAAVGGEERGKRQPGHSRPDGLNQTTVSVSPDEVRIAVNGRANYIERSPATTSPWVFLTAGGLQPTVWRFPGITGNPVIPRSVELITGPALRGWTTVALENSRVTPFPAEVEADTDTNTHDDWQWKGGTVIGRSASSPGRTRPHNSQDIHDMLTVATSGRLLQYDRPLHNGDTISWEFDYAPDLRNSGVAVGRTVYNIEPDGLYRHYLTSPENWFGIPDDNLVQLPTDTGHNPPLRQGWNAASLTLRDDQLILSLNGVILSSGMVAEPRDRQFGLYHDSRRYEAHVRNVVLTGDWPDTLPNELRHQLTAASATPAEVNPMAKSGPESTGPPTSLSPFASPVDGPGSSAVRLQPPNNSATVIAHAATLPITERFEYLKRLILPGPRQPGFRIPGGTRVVANGGHRLRNTLTPDELDSPVYHLIDTGLQLGRLAELRHEIIEAPAPTTADVRASYGLRTLIAITRKDLDAAEDSLQQCVSLRQLDQVRSLVGVDDQEDDDWIDVLVAARAVPHPELWQSARSALQVGSMSDSVLARQRLHLYHRFGRSLDGSLTQPPILWHAVDHSHADARGQGLPASAWTQDQHGVIRHWPGHDDDHLFLQSPITGDFSLQLQMTARKGQSIQFGYGGFGLGFVPDNNRQVFLYPFGRAPRRYWQNPPTLRFDDWINIEMHVTESEVTCMVDGRTVHKNKGKRDPWLFARSAAAECGSIRNVQMTGNPVIPRSFMLDTTAEFQGWTARCYGEAVGRGKSWQSTDGIIEASAQPEAGHDLESLLQYHRPFMEDGTIEYQFYYIPGSQLLHPAVGRLAFLLTPHEGVVTHECTNGRYDFEGRTADNRRIDRKSQQMQNLPLISNSWNNMAVTIDGNQLILTLNQQEVFRTRLKEPPRNRVFGLFHYRDQTSGRVRTIQWTGNWPKTLPKTLLPGLTKGSPIR